MAEITHAKPVKNGVTLNIIELDKFVVCIQRPKHIFHNPVRSTETQIKFSIFIFLNKGKR